MSWQIEHKYGGVLWEREVPNEWLNSWTHTSPTFERALAFLLRKLGETPGTGEAVIHAVALARIKLMRPGDPPLVYPYTQDSLTLFRIMEVQEN